MGVGTHARQHDMRATGVVSKASTPALGLPAAGQTTAGTRVRSRSGMVS